MNLDITPAEASTIAAGLGLLGEAAINPALINRLSPAGRGAVRTVQEAGQWPSPLAVMNLLTKVLARLQVELEAK